MTRREQFRLSFRPELAHSADAVRAGDHLFVAGILPVDAEGNLVGGDDVVEQTRHVLHDLRAILEIAGCTIGDVVKVNVYLTDVRDRSLINPLRQEAFGPTRPASTLVGVTELAVPGARVEIDAVAVVR